VALEETEHGVTICPRRGDLRYDNVCEGPMDLPSDDVLRRIVGGFAHLRAAHGGAIGTPALIQPTPDFFPDVFRADAPSVERLLRRMVEHSPLAEGIGIELAFLLPEEGLGGGCGSAACGTDGRPGGRDVNVHDLGHGYRVLVTSADVSQPDILAASLARSVGALVLHEAGERVGTETSEIAAVVCGFGVLLANGASVWAKACGGLRMAQATVLSVEEIAVALALFAAVHECKGSQARRHLGATQREAFDVAEDWVDSNPMLVESLRNRPDSLESGTYDLEPVRGLLGQWLHKRSLEKALRARPRDAAPSMSEERLRRVAEVSALLDEIVRDGES
jgi:hypothetical protein